MDLLDKSALLYYQQWSAVWFSKLQH